MNHKDLEDFLDNLRKAHETFDGIDLREIKCCSTIPKNHQAGISFDWFDEKTPLLRFHYLTIQSNPDKSKEGAMFKLVQEEKSMHLNRENIDQLISALQEIRKKC